MSLTVKDILEKTFKRSFKGYDEDEVDKFLDQIIDEIKVLKNENAELLKGQKSALEQSDKIKQTEEAIMNTLVSAQKSSERIMNEAARKAELILESAERTAKQKKETTARALVESERKLEIIRGSAKRFSSSFANMINTQAADFEKNYQSYFGEMDAFADNVMNIKEPDKVKEDFVSSTFGIIQNEPEEEKLVSEPEAQMISDLSPEVENFVEPSLKPEPEPDMPKETQTVDVKPLEVQPKEALSEQRSSVEQEPEIDKKPEAEPLPDPKDGGLMELHEINKALSELEKGEDILPENKEQQSPKEKLAQGDSQKKTDKSAYKQKYDDYSWLYENDDKPEDDDFELSFKNPKEKEELKSLIDEIID